MKRKVSMGRDFKINHQNELELTVDYGIEGLRKRLWYVDHSWLLSIQNPTILITGAAGFIGRYMVDLLVEEASKKDYTIIASDLNGKPAYLNQPKYSRVIYQAADLRSDESIDRLIKGFNPHLIFHLGAIFDFYAPEDLLYEVNVSGVKRVCRAASESGTKRIIYWSTGAIYAELQEPIKEHYPLQPRDSYAQSKLDGEREAFKFHNTKGMGVYTIRPASVTGPLSHYGSGLVIYLLYKGWLIGPPQRKGLITSIVHVKDVVIGAYLLALKDLRDLPSEDHNDTAFNISEDPVEMDKILNIISDKLPRDYFLGIKTEWAPILKLSYQDEVRVPEAWMDVYAKGSEFLNEIFNCFRYEKRYPIIPRKTIPYINLSIPMNSEKVEKWLGWKPKGRINEIDETIRYYVETNWQGFERVSHIDNQMKSSIELFQKAMNSARIVESYSLRDEGTGRQKITIPSLDWEIDTKSLYILLSKGRRYYLSSVVKNRLWRMLWSNLANLIMTEIPTEFIELAQCEGFKLLINGKQNLKERLANIHSYLSHMDGKNINLYLLTIAIVQVIQRINECFEHFSKLMKLFPEKRYGILIESDLGYVGLEVNNEGQSITVDFPRDQVDKILHRDLSRAVKEFKKYRKLDFVIGTDFDNLLMDLKQEKFHEQVMKKIGIDYVTSNPVGNLRALYKEFFDSRKNQYLFMDEFNNIDFGVKIKDGAIIPLSAKEVNYYNRLLEDLFNTEELTEEIERQSNGVDRLGFINSSLLKERIDDILFPSLVTKIYGVVKR